MSRTVAISAAIFAALLIAAPARPGAAGSSRDWQNLGAHETMPVQIGGPLLYSFANAKLTIDQAIGAARDAAGFGKVLSAVFKQNGTIPAWAVRVDRGHSVWVGFIDANKGRVIGFPNNIPEKSLGKEAKPQIAAVRNAALSLADAVKKAERIAGAHAINAALVLPENRSEYLVEIVKDRAVHFVAIDTATGKAEAGLPRISSAGGHR